MTEHDRGRHGHGWTLVTPANHYPSRLPSFGVDTPVVKLVTPRLTPSRIGEYLIALPAGGGTVEPVGPGFETFLYALDGAATLIADRITEIPLGGGAYAYLPETSSWELRAGDTPARVLLVKRRHEPWGSLPAPGLRHGHRDDEPFVETAVEGFTRRELLPVDDPAFDLAMSLLRFAPGVGLAVIEVHDEEHGLYMTRGGGDYVLDGNVLPVQEDDFIYMAPYCPQGFTAGAEGGEYLLYKDAWRDGF